MSLLKEKGANQGKRDDNVTLKGMKFVAAGIMVCEIVNLASKRLNVFSGY